MSSGRPLVGQLEQSLGDMTVDLLKGAEARRTEDAALGGSDMVQHVKVSVSGNVGKNPITARVDIRWPHPIFTMDPELTESDFETPHFNVGVECASDMPIIITPRLQFWIPDESGFWVGARLVVMAWIPNAPKKRRFSATLDVSVYGWAAPQADEE